MPLDQNPYLTVTCFGCVGSFNVKVRVFKCPNATILLVYIPPKIKMSFIWKDDFYFKISIFCKSTAGPLPSVVQAYTQPYSFRGRIKLIIFQIRQELSITIHDINISWRKKNAIWWTQYMVGGECIKFIFISFNVLFSIYICNIYIVMLLL